MADTVTDKDSTLPGLRVYRRRDGELFEVVDYDVTSESDGLRWKHMVLYRSVDTGKLYVITHSEFFGCDHQGVRLFQRHIAQFESRDGVPEHG